MIGIVGGAGPLVGLDIVKKIIEETIAAKDEDHIPLILHSQPGRIANCTQFLTGDGSINPAHAIADTVAELVGLGATVAAVPCNTAHAAPIFDVVRTLIQSKGLSIKLLNLVEETVHYIASNYDNPAVGVLSSNGTRDTGLYKKSLAIHSLNVVEPVDDWQQKIHQAIYDEQYGIKSHASPITNRAKEELIAAIHEMKKEGATVIVLGCTELPLALREKEIAGLPIVDPHRVLARALIRTVAPQKLQK